MICDPLAQLKGESIICHVAQFTGRPVAEIRGRHGSRQTSMWRDVAIYLVREITGESFPEIGKRFSGKHHTTILAAYRRTAKRLELNEELRERVAGWRAQL